MRLRRSPKGCPSLLKSHRQRILQARKRSLMPQTKPKSRSLSASRNAMQPATGLRETFSNPKHSDRSWGLRVTTRMSLPISPGRPTIQASICITACIIWICCRGLAGSPFADLSVRVNVSEPGHILVHLGFECENGSHRLCCHGHDAIARDAHRKHDHYGRSQAA